jgi:hypothetical protein
VTLGEHAISIVFYPLLICIAIAASMAYARLAAPLRLWRDLPLLAS